MYECLAIASFLSTVPIIAADKILELAAKVIYEVYIGIGPNILVQRERTREEMYSYHHSIEVLTVKLKLFFCSIVVVVPRIYGINKSVGT